MIIDHVDKFELSDEEVKRYHNVLNLLKTLATGLEYLSNQVSKFEDEIRDGQPTRVFGGGGNHPMFRGIPMDLIYCAFKWYSVTACDYVRTIGWLTHGENKEKARDYLIRVIPEVRNWRNKVGAHLALTDPRRDDTPADLFIISSTWEIGFHDGFVAGPLIATLGSTDGGSTSRQDRKWSLTDTHKQLASRYAWDPTHGA